MSLIPSQASKTYRLNVPPKARTSETSEMLCKPNAGTKSAVDKRFVSGLSPGRDALFVPRCTLVDRRLFVFVNPFHARHVREYILHEKSLKEQIDIGTLVSSQEQKERFSPLLQTSGTPLVKGGLCSSNGLHRMSLVRACEELFTTIVFVALMRTRHSGVMRKQIRRRHTLPGPPSPAAQPCAARPDPPAVCPGFGFPNMPCMNKGIEGRTRSSDRSSRWKIGLKIQTSG